MLWFAIQFKKNNQELYIEIHLQEILMDPFRKGKPIGSQARKIVVKIYNDKLEEAKNSFLENPVSYATTQTVETTGISERSIRRIIKEYEETGVVQSPNKKVQHTKWKTGLDEFDIAAIRRIMHNFHQEEKMMISLKMLRQRVQEDLELNLSITSLNRILRRNGFSYKKTQNNRKLLCERNDIKLMRVKYLRKIREYRTKGYDIIYLDESYIHSSHTRPRAWTDDSSSGLKTPISKGQRLIMAHAGGEKGFVKNSLLLFKSGTKTGDYHDDMNFENFCKWIQEQVLNNLEEPSVIVMDNASYHNKLEEKQITSASKKSEMIQWLTENNIPYTIQMLKLELYEVIKRHRATHNPKHKIDDIIHGMGHEVLRLPPYHPDLNPIENIWATVKARVGSRNTTFNLLDVQKLAEEEFSKITAEDWRKVCEKAIRTEEEYFSHDLTWDTISDSIIINPGDDSSTDYESDISS